MNQAPIIYGHECSQCKKPMIWKCVQLVQAQPMNVFLCAVCDKLCASVADTIAALVD